MKLNTKGLLVVISGPSGVGKGTVRKALFNRTGHNLDYSVSMTTRKPREGEVDGVDYNFIDKSQFRRLKIQNFFAETATYNEWYYGTAKKDCTNDKVAVLTPHGLRQLKKIDGIEITSFYINVPRRDRLIKILQRGDNIEEAYRRSLSDVGMFDGIKDEVDFVIDNFGYEKSIEKMTNEILAKL